MCDYCWKRLRRKQLNENWSAEPSNVECALPRCVSMLVTKMKAKSFFSAPSTRSRQCNTVQYRTERPQMCVWGSRASVHYSSPCLSPSPVPTSVLPSLYARLSRSDTCPLNVPCAAPPSPSRASLPPFTRYKNTLTVVLSVLLYSRLKRPIIPPTGKSFDEGWPVCYYPSLFRVVIHLIGFHFCVRAVFVWLLLK